MRDVSTWLSQLGCSLVMLLCSCFSAGGFAQEPAFVEGEQYKYLGIARAQQQATLRIPKQGLVQEIHVREGERVKKGMKLLTLDDRIVQAALRMATIEAENDASLKISRIEVGRLQLMMQRTEEGVQQKAVGQFELEAKRTEFQRAAAQLELEMEKKEQLIAKRNMAQQEADSMALFAPFDGVVTHIHAKLGDAIGPSENAISIANADFLEFELHLPLELYGQLKVGQKYQLRGSEPVSTNLTVVARYVSPEVESTSGSFRAVFDFDNRQEKFPSGFEVHFIPNTATVVTVNESRRQLLP